MGYPKRVVVLTGYIRATTVNGPYRVYRKRKPTDADKALRFLLPYAVITDDAPRYRLVLERVDPKAKRKGRRQ